MASRAVEDALDIAFHECNLSVLHNFNFGGKYFKFVHFSAMNLPPLLYCLDEDPEESQDLVAAGNHSDVVLVRQQYSAAAIPLRLTTNNDLKVY